VQAQDAGELSFKVGDIVVVSNQDDSGYLLNDASQRSSSFTDH